VNIIEQAAKRIEQLQRAGVDVPWSANGVAPAEAAAQAGPVAPAAPAAPAGAETPAVSINGATLPVHPASASASAAEPARRLDKSGEPRRSRDIDLDLNDLMARGFLVPGTARSKMEEEFRIIKRPLLRNCSPETVPAIHRGNLIMMTSALPGEGKTFCAINLAMSIAMELDHTVLLVDADVVRPSVLNRLSLPAAPGLMDVLRNPELDLADVLLKTNIPKLTILPAGGAHNRSTELLASSSMETLLDELATLYSDRIVIFDAPPLLPSTESRVLATHMGQVVVVVEANKTSRSSVAQAFATLEQCPVVMGMLNKSVLAASNTPYGYYAV
jgi:protein-tyrosine kinase